MEWIKSLFSGGEGMLPMILASVVAFNAILVAIKALVDVIKDKTKSSLDNSVSKWIGKIAEYVQKGIDIVGGNPKH